MNENEAAAHLVDQIIPKVPVLTASAESKTWFCRSRAEGGANRLYKATLSLLVDLRRNRPHRRSAHRHALVHLDAARHRGLWPGCRAGDVLDFAHQRAYGGDTAHRQRPPQYDRQSRWPIDDRLGAPAHRLIRSADLCHRGAVGGGDVCRLDYSPESEFAAGTPCMPRN